MPSLFIHLINYGTLTISLALFICALLWVIRPGGVPLLVRISPREQGLRRARKLLATGDWQAAFAAGGQLRNAKRPDLHFDSRIQNFEGDCLYRAAELSLQGRRYAEALELMRGAGDRLGLPEAEFDKRIAELLLAELRRRIASDPKADEIRRLAQEINRVESAHPEGSFWLALHHLYAGRMDSAREALHDAIAAAGVPDPALYLGALLLRQDQPNGAVECLRQAHELAPECPIIWVQLGTALITAGGDATTAVQLLEKATGPTGLVKFAKTPNAIWSALGPRSWLAALARRAPIGCPLGLERIEESLALARRSLAAALELCDRSTDAATIYYQSYSAGDHTLEVRKGLGLSLSRSSLHDDALPHLQASFEQENPPSPALMGHLALSLARSRAIKPADHLKHMQHALSVLTTVDARGDTEWASVAREVVLEAKKADVDLSPAHRLALARAFAANDANDAVALETYDHLANEGNTLPMEIAVAYVRAATENNARVGNDEKLFDRAFRERELLKRMFAEHKWNFARAERQYLERWVQRHPGRYPDAPGPLYGAIAERTLIDEVRRCVVDDRPDDGREVLDLAFRLGPTRALTLDLLAEQADRRGDHADVAQYLDTWTKHHPHDPRPLVRRALIERRDGKAVEALEHLTDACAMAAGPQRARLLAMTARIALAAQNYEVAEELFEQSRLLAPQAAEPITGLAALAWQRRDFDKLASLAPLFNRSGSTDSVRSLLAAASFALAGDDNRATEEINIARLDPALAAEAAYLRAVMLTWQDKDDEACITLDLTTFDAGPMREMVHALRGQLAWKAGNFTDALLFWSELSPERRAAWGLERHNAAAAFRYGMAELAADRPAEAVEWLGQARTNGFQHERLAVIEATARQRAGQPAVQGNEQTRQLEAVLPPDSRSANTSAWIARMYRREGDVESARRVLAEVAIPTWHVAMQSGLLALHEGRLDDAEKAFIAAKEQAPDTIAIEYNLAFTRLTLGRHEEAAADFERAAELHPNPEAQRVLSLLAALCPRTVRRDVLAAMTPVDDQRVIKRIQQIGRIDTVLTLLQSLAAARPQSGVVLQALTEAYVLWTRNLIDRGEPEVALAAATKWPAAPARPLGNLLGVAAGVIGNRDQALQYFQSSLPTAEDDARIQQNLAIATSRSGDSGRAKHHWKRFLVGQPAHCPAPTGDANYLFRVGEVVRQRLDDCMTETPR